MLQLGQSLLHPEGKNVTLRQHDLMAKDSSKLISMAVIQLPMNITSKVLNE